jgi:hypothetical protein
MVWTGLSQGGVDPAQVGGTWLITIKFISGTGNHTAVIEQEGETLSGVYKGAFLEGTLKGEVKGNSIDFTGSLKHEATPLRFHYTGTVEESVMTGKVDMGEYWTATWTAKRADKK